MTGLSTQALYLVLVAIELLLPGSDLTVDYMQDGVPAARLEVDELPGSERDLFLVRAFFSSVAESTAQEDEAQELLYRIEQSDIDSSNYLLYGPQQSVPTVVSLARALQAFPATAPDGDYVLELTSGGTASGAANDSEYLSGPVYVLPRAPYLILSLANGGMVLVVEPSP